MNVFERVAFLLNEERNEFLAKKIRGAKESEDSFKEQIINWNLNFPIDFLFRKKFNIVFGSKRHREMRFEDMIFELSERFVFKEIIKNSEQKPSMNLMDYVEVVNDLDISDIFDSLDISELNKTQNEQQ